MDKITELKFIVPPVIFFIFLGLVNFKETSTFLCSFHDITSILFTTIAILGMGFLISSLVNFVLFLHEKKPPFYPREEELKIWKEQTKKGEHVIEQIKKRWDIAMVNLNSFCALILVVITIFIKRLFSDIPHIWWFLGLFLIIFWVAYKKASNDVRYFNQNL